MKKRFVSFALALCLVLSVAPVCWAQDFTGTTVRLAQQYGMQYAPVYVMQKLGILEKHLPGATLEWNNLGGGSAINEALIASRLDIGFMGVPPMLIAWDKGVDYRIASGVSIQPGQLMVRDESIQSFSDIQPQHKIALPGIGSLQHIWLAMAAEAELGDPHALDNNIIAMANPDAYAALLSGTDIIGHYTSMPYIAMEQENGMHGVAKASDVFPEGSGIVCVATKALYEQTEVYRAFISALNESIELVNAQGDEVVRVIAEVEQLTEDEVRAYLNWEGVGYTRVPAGAMSLAEFMRSVGYIKNQLGSVEDICWPGAAPAE